MCPRNSKKYTNLTHFETLIKINHNATRFSRPDQNFLLRYMNFKVLILRMFSVVTWGQALFSFHFENTFQWARWRIAVRENVWELLKLGLISGYSMGACQLLIDELFLISLWSEMLIIILKNEEKKVLLKANTYSSLLKRSLKKIL